VLAKRNLLLIRHPASPAVLLIYIVCLVTDGGKLRKNENVHCHIYEIWLFRNDQPDHDYDPRIFVAMTSFSKICTVVLRSAYIRPYDFTFPTVNFPFISSNITASPTYGVYTSQLIYYSRTCAN
jgi:hypothetical protein